MGNKITNEKLVSFPSPLRSVGTNEEGNPILRGMGIVFGGRDLYGDTFSPPRTQLAGDDPDLQVGTDYFLRELADEVDFETGDIKGALPVPLFWDHGRGIFGAKRFGKAYPVKVTEQGIEYILEIEKRRAEDYQAMIDELMELGYLGLSTQTLRSFVDFDWGTDEIKGWFPAEISLTVTPAEHRTRDEIHQVRSLFKKYNIEVDMPEDLKDQEVVQTPDPARAVNEMFDGLEQDLAEEAQEVAQNQVLASVIRSMDLINERLDAINERLALTATTEEVAELRQGVEEAQEQYVEAVRTFGTRVGDVLRQQARSGAAALVRNSSMAELDALRDVEEETPPAPTRTASGYRLPSNAPGQN